MSDPSLLGPWVRRFLLDHVVVERNLARSTQQSYRDALSLLIPFVARQSTIPPDRLDLEDERHIIANATFHRWFVEAGFGDTGLEVVADDLPRYPAEGSQCVDVRTDPIGQRLACSGFGVDEARCPQHGDKHLVPSSPCPICRRDNRSLRDKSPFSESRAAKSP
jgi:hypothetical protein